MGKKKEPEVIYVVQKESKTKIKILIGIVVFIVALYIMGSLL